MGRSGVGDGVGSGSGGSSMRGILFIVFCLCFFRGYGECAELFSS